MFGRSHTNNSQPFLSAVEHVVLSAFLTHSIWVFVLSPWMFLVSLFLLLGSLANKRLSINCTAFEVHFFPHSLQTLFVRTVLFFNLPNREVIISVMDFLPWSVNTFTGNILKINFLSLCNRTRVVTTITLCHRTIDVIWSSCAMPIDWCSISRPIIFQLKCST